MRFTDAYAVPLCSPTRASILTGQYSARHRITSATGHRPAAPPDASPYPEKAAPGRRLLYADSKNYLDPDSVTLAEVLRDAGYRTGHFGKWHLGLMPEHWPDKQGFETTWHCAPDPGPPNYFSPYGVHADGRPTGQHKVGNITDGPDGEHIADRLTDEAIEVHRGTPRRTVLPESLALLRARAVATQGGVHGRVRQEDRPARRAAQSGHGLDAPMRRRQPRPRSRQAGRAGTDRQHAVHLLLRQWRQQPQLASGRLRSSQNVTDKHPLYDTIQSYRKWAGDEPPTNNAPLREGKGRIYEGGQRVPLMVRWPGKIEPGTTSDAVVGAIDLYPTILDALGLEKPSGHIIDGVSFLPVLTKTGPA